MGIHVPHETLGFPPNIRHIWGNETSQGVCLGGTHAAHQLNELGYPTVTRARAALA